jgi:RNA polymerase sigma factor (sigma-70 family)
MPAQPLNAVLHYLHRSLDAGSASRSDGDLLARFALDREPAAFEELVRRHEAMVMNVCRRLLGPGADADDAFQATFFIFARKARSIRKPDAVGSWLHGVAHRLSQQMLSKMSARQRWEVKMRPTAQSMPARDDPVHLASMRELGAILDDELRNLPTVCRAALVACHLQGLSTAEAAQRLGVPASTLKSRLQRGRDLLRQRLERRGIGLSSAALAAVLAEQGSAGATPTLVHVTVQTALCVAASPVATRAASLAASALRTGAGGKVKLAVGAMLAFALVGLGVALSTSVPAGPAASGFVSPGQNVAPADKGKEQARLDRLGDPLPPGAILRLGTVRLRHPWGVRGIAFSRDGKQLVSGSGHTIYVWEAATGKQVRQLDGINFMGIAVSPVGDVMASAQNGHVQVWDLATGKPKFKHDVSGFAVAISPDGSVLATGGRTPAKGDPVVLWDLRTGDKLRSLPANMYQVFRLAFSPDGKSLAAVSCGNSSFAPPKSSRPQLVRLWEVETGQLHELDGHTGGATSLAFSPDGKVLATAGHDGTMILWDSATRKQLRKIDLVEEAYVHRKGNGFDSGGIHALAFAPDGKTIASANHDGTVRLFDAGTGKQVHVFRGHAGSVFDVAFSPDGKILASASADQTVRLWDAATGALLHPRPGHDGGIGSVVISPDGKRAVSAGYDRTLRIWDLATGQELLALRDFKSAIYALSLSPDGKMIAAGMENGVIQLRDAVSGAVLRELKGHSGMVNSLSFSPDAKTLASASPSGANSNLAAKEAVRSLRLWDVGTGQELPRFQGNRNDWYAHFSPDGKWLAVYERDVALWEPATGKKLRTLDGLRDFAFLPDGKRIVGWLPAPREGGVGSGYGGEKGKVQIRSLADGAAIYSFDAPERTPIIGGVFVLSPDGRLLALAVSDGGFQQNVLQLWEMATGKLRRTLKGHGGEVTGCAFSPNGRVVLSASADTTVLVWDLAEPSEQQPRPLTEKTLEALWDDLGSADAGRADQAIWALVAVPQQALPFVQKHLPPTPAPHPDWRVGQGSRQRAIRGARQGYPCPGSPGGTGLSPLAAGAGRRTHAGRTPPHRTPAGPVQIPVDFWETAARAAGGRGPGTHWFGASQASAQGAGPGSTRVAANRGGQGSPETSWTVTDQATIRAPLPDGRGSYLRRAATVRERR